MPPVLRASYGATIFTPQAVKFVSLFIDTCKLGEFISVILYSVKLWVSFACQSAGNDYEIQTIAQSYLQTRIGNGLNGRQFNHI